MVSKRAFTIVELLVVIIVIAVLVTLSIVGYSNISSKAIVSTLQSDLTNAKKALLAFQAQSSSNSFPTAINCTNPSATEICIKPSSSATTFTYSVNNSSVPPNFNLTATNGPNKYWINDSSSIQTTPDIVPNGLVLHLDAGHPASYTGTGTTWYDLSGNSNNGTLMNGTTYSSSNAGAMNFSELNSQFVQVENSASLNPSNLSVFVWAKSSASKWNDNGFLVSKRNVFVVHNNINNTSVSCYIYANSSWVASGCGSSTNITSWAQYGFTWDGSTLSGYFNGTQSNTTTPTGPINTLDTGVITIGRDDSFARYMSGSISNVLIYSRALSQSEITQNFNALRGRYGI